jgi:hypothetical protein
MAGTNGGNDFTGIAAAYKVSAGGGGGAVSTPGIRCVPGFMTGTAFPSFMDAPNITGWSPFGTAYDLGTGGPQAYTSPLTGDRRVHGSRHRPDIEGPDRSDGRVHRLADQSASPAP